MHALIVDTETTGLDAPQVIQLATRGPLEFRNVLAGEGLPAIQVDRYRPTKPISIGALATHHILEEELEDCPVFYTPWQPSEGVTYLVGHGIDHDWEALGKPDVKRICTLHMAKYVWPDLDSYKLVALIYFLYLPKIAKQMVQQAHDAAADVALASLVLDHMLGDIATSLNIYDWESLWKYSEDCRVPRRVDFGNVYGPGTEWGGAKGALYTDVAQTERGRGYLEWMITKPDFDPYKLIAARRALGKE